MSNLLILTGIVDTFLVEVQWPNDSMISNALYHGKYGTTVYKFQNVVDFLGRIICFTGVHLGKTCDSAIWNGTHEMHPLKPQEIIMADGAYIAVDQLLCPFRQPPSGHLTYEQYSLSNLFPLSCKSWALKWKIEKTCHYGIFFHIIAHCQNVHQHMYLSYEPSGPYSHFWLFFQ